MCIRDRTVLDSKGTTFIINQKDNVKWIILGKAIDILGILENTRHIQSWKHWVILLSFNTFPSPPFWAADDKNWIKCNRFSFYFHWVCKVFSTLLVLNSDGVTLPLWRMKNYYMQVASYKQKISTLTVRSLTAHLMLHHKVPCPFFQAKMHWWKCHNRWRT